VDESSKKRDEAKRYQYDKNFVVLAANNAARNYHHPDGENGASPLSFSVYISKQKITPATITHLRV